MVSSAPIVLLVQEEKNGMQEGFPDKPKFGLFFVKIRGNLN